MPIKYLVTLLLTAGAIGAATTPRFYDRLDYFGLSFFHIAVADFNGDGKADVISADSGGVFLLAGNGDGTFQAPVLLPVSLRNAGWATAADMNGDGIPDLVAIYGVTILDPVGVAVMLGKGDGTFTPPAFYQLGAMNLSIGAVLVGDFDGNGIPDLVAFTSLTTEDGDINTAWVLLGIGGGALAAPREIPIPLNGGADTGDVNGDGLSDLVMVVNGGFASLLSNGDGTFRLITTKTSAAASGTQVKVADVNNDGVPDVCLTNVNSNSIYLFPGNGDGTFQSPGAVTVPGGGIVQVGDVNKDGIADLVSNGVYVALGKGGGSFQSPAYYPVASAPNGFAAAYQVVLADTRDSGQLDAIAVDNLAGLSVLLNQGNGTYEDGVITRVSGAPSCGAAADFNRDGKPDVALGTGTGITVLFGTGKANKPFTKGPVTSVPNSYCIAAGDLNNDGIPDLLVTVLLPPPADTTTEYSYLGNGDGTFRQAGATPVSAYGSIILLADFNHDGKLDFATSGNVLALGNGDGTFQTPTTFLPPNQVLYLSGLVAGDLNGDGYPDLVPSDGQHQNLYVLLNDRKGGWQETMTYVNPVDCGTPTVGAIADVTGDGRPDLVAGCGDYGGAIYTVSPMGKLTYYLQLFDTALGTHMALVADVNGDGIPDVEFETYHDIGVYLGQGGGAFAAPFFLGTGPTPDLPIPMNLHGQGPGLVDFVVPDASGRVLSIINQTKP